MDKPYYGCASIGSVDVLAKTLGVNVKILESIVSKVDDSYTSYDLAPHPVTGKVRTVVEPKHDLKKLQKRINSRIFCGVKFPSYLQGGIASTEDVDRSYIKNAEIHCSSRTLINLDIKNFYTNIKYDVVFDIYKNFFRFSIPVCDVLTKLTTYKKQVPQGACTSSYLANLVFYNNEYLLVSFLRGKGFSYSRLLDDITISAKSECSEILTSDIIKRVASMLRKKDLKINNKKTKITDKREEHKEYKVTGLWVKHATPKLRKDERRYIRMLVYVCECKAQESRSTDEYHAFWNKTSGLVAKLKQLSHSQADSYRKRLSSILPICSEEKVYSINRRVKNALKIPVADHGSVSVIRRYNKLMYQLGILSRTEPELAKSLRKKMLHHYPSIKTINEYWHG
ncbi:reverse transcriptase family protein [Plesiomonas shigelloides]|uniref:reverse transcriptase family protein n=1 Tax=Plesiomonas shigelloides TaxID=703 RepID=UPI001262694F|nr:reverse transcriptase family protein [Plesiomonas shigelloides]KAB7663876.1 RNA-directed DNA polymerase [Plesiomonas shigelloides]